MLQLIYESSTGQDEQGDNFKGMKPIVPFDHLSCYSQDNGIIRRYDCIVIKITGINWNIFSMRNFPNTATRIHFQR